MKTRPISTPEKPKDTSRMFDTTEPLLRLRDMGDDEFERVVGEWAYSCLKNSEKYSNVAEVTVISAFHFFHFHPVPDAELLHFSFRKTHAGG